MDIKHSFAFNKKPPLSLVLLAIVMGLSSLEDVISGEIKTYDFISLVLMIGLYVSLWFLINGESWARKVIIGFSAALLIASFGAEEKEISYIYVHYVETIVFILVIFYLNSKPIKKYFEVPSKTKDKVGGIEYYGFIKKCPECASKLRLKPLLMLLRGREVRCHYCESALRQERKDNSGWIRLLVLEFLLVPMIVIPIFLSNDKPEAALFVLPFFIMGIILKLKTSDVVRFTLPDKKYLNVWVKGDEPGKSPTEKKREVFLDISYTDAFLECRGAIDRIGAKFEWQDIDKGIIRGHIPMGNSFGELILFNILKSGNGVQLKIYCRNVSNWATDDLGRTDFIVENLYRAIKGDQILAASKSKAIKDILMAVPFVTALLILAKSFDLTVGGVSIIENTFDGFRFFVITSLVYFGFYKGLQKPASKIFIKHFCYPNASIAKDTPLQKIVINMMLLPIFAVIHTFLYMGNSYFDKSQPEVVLGYVGGLEKVGEKEHTDYCFYVFLDKTENERVTDQRYCFKEGFQGLRTGDKVKLLSKTGFFGVRWAIDIDLAKYESLESLVSESNGSEKININDIKHIQPTSRNYRRFASLWETECEHDKPQFCRLSAYLKWKENKTDDQFKLLKKACAIGDGESCFNLFSMKKMSSVEANTYRRKLENGCESKSPESCYYWGSLLSADSGKRDFKKLKSYFEIACKGKIMNSCTDLKIIELDKI